MPIHDMWSYDAAVQGATDVSTGTSLAAYVENGLYNQYSGLPGMLYKNTSATAALGVDGFLTLTAAGTLNACLLVQAKEVQDWSVATQYWLGFRTKTTSQNVATAHVFKLVDVPGMTNASVFLLESDLTAAGANVSGTEYYVEVFVDRVNLVYQVWVNGIQIKNGAISAASVIANGGSYYVYGATGSPANPVNGNNRSFRDYYFVDVDAIKTPGRLGSVRSSPQITPLPSAPNNGSLYQSTISATQSKFGGSSLSVGAAAASVVTVPDSPALRLGVTGDCTVECWVYYTGGGTTPVVFGKQINNLPNYAHLTMSSGNWVFYTDSGAAVMTVASGAITNTWVHIAAVKQGTTWTLYQNGVALGSVNNNGTFGNNSAPFLIGNWGGLNSQWLGFIDEFRISNIARYTAAFTPPTQVFTPDANTLALWHMESSVLGQILDSVPAFTPTTLPTSPNAVGYSAQLLGSAGLSTTQAKFGTSSFVTNGVAGSCAQIPDAPQLRLINDWTIEFFTYNPSPATVMMYLNKGTNAYLFNNAGTLGLSLDPANSLVINVAGLLKANQWQHIAVTKLGLNVQLWVDGVLAGSLVAALPNGTFGNVASPYQIGMWTNNTDEMVGFMDELRISNIARYIAPFTPPTQQFVVDANTLVLMHFESVFNGMLADDACNVADLLQTPYLAPPGVLPMLVTSPTNDPVTVPLGAPTPGKLLAVDFRLGIKANNGPASMSGQLNQGSNNQATPTLQLTDNSLGYARRLALTTAAPDGGAWTQAKIGTTSLVLTPNT
jgi:hypothetical protein